MAGTRGDEGLAELFQHIRREALAVIGDLDPDFVLRPARLDLDLAPGEVDGVLHEIAEAVDHAGIALHDRFLRKLVAFAPGGSRLNFDRHRDQPVRRTDSSMRWLMGRRETMKSGWSPMPASSPRMVRQRSAWARNSTRSS